MLNFSAPLIFVVFKIVVRFSLTKICCENRFFALLRMTKISSYWGFSRNIFFVGAFHVSYYYRVLFMFSCLLCCFQQQLPNKFYIIKFDLNVMNHHYFILLPLFRMTIIPSYWGFSRSIYYKIIKNINKKKPLFLTEWRY